MSRKPSVKSMKPNNPEGAPFEVEKGQAIERIQTDSRKKGKKVLDPVDRLLVDMMNSERRRIPFSMFEMTKMVFKKLK